MKSLKSIFVVMLFLFEPWATQAQEIFDALRNGDAARVGELVEKDPMLVKAKNSRQSTPLRVSVDMNNVPIASYLIEKGADLNAAKTNRWSPLFYAKEKEIAQ